jgi:hypothetical protein
MDTAPSKYDKSLKHGPPRPAEDSLRLNLYLTPRQQMSNSAVCWINTTSRISVLPMKIYSYLTPVKNALGLRMRGVYSIPCESGQVYIVQSGRFIQIRNKEPRHIMALSRIVLLNRTSFCKNWVHRLEMHSHSINREYGLILSKS